MCWSSFSTLLLISKPTHQQDLVLPAARVAPFFGSNCGQEMTIHNEDFQPDNELPNLMSKRETNAEKLAEKLNDTIFQSMLRCVKEGDEVQANGDKILDILASWRTCGSCSGVREFEGIAPEGSSAGPIMHMCNRRESPCFSCTLDLDKDTCGHWEEVVS